MINSDIKIFLIEPGDKSYNTKIVWANNEEDARSSASAHANPAMRSRPASERGRIPEYNENNQTYRDPEQSSCKRVSAEILKQTVNTLKIQYQGKEYIFRDYDTADDI